MAAAKKPVEKTIDEEIEADERRVAEGGVEVDLSEPDEVDDPDEEPAQQPSRRDKRKQRGTVIKENETLREENQRLAAEAAEARARAAEAAGWAQGRAAALQGPQKDPIDAQLEQVEQANEDLIATIRAEEKTMTPEREKQLRERAKQITYARTYLIQQKAIQAQQPSQAQLQAQQRLNAIQATYPDITANPQAFAWADSRFRQLRAEGAADSWETVQMAMNESRARYNPGARQPDPTMERKLQAQPKGAGTAPSGGSKVQLTAKDIEMANAAFEHIKDPKERLRAYAKTIQKGQAKTA